METIKKVLKWWKTNMRYIVISVFIPLLLIGIFPFTNGVSIGYVIIYSILALLVSFEIKCDLAKSISKFRTSIRGYLWFGLQLSGLAVLIFGMLAFENRSFYENIANLNQYVVDMTGKYLDGFGALLVSVIVVSIVLLGVWLVLSLFADVKIVVLVNAIFTFGVNLIHQIVNYIFSFLPNSFFAGQSFTDKEAEVFTQYCRGMSPKGMLLLILNTFYMPLFVIGGIITIVGVIKGYRQSCRQNVNSFREIKSKIL